MGSCGSFSAMDCSPAPTESGQSAVCILIPLPASWEKRLEGRVAKRFGYIIITVILFWPPRFVILFVNMSEDFSQNQHWLLREFETCALVLSCGSAAVEPLIYALLHRQIRTQLLKLFRNKNCLMDQSNPIYI